MRSYAPRMQRQRRGAKIAMTSDELDAYLTEARTCTVATIGLNGPHASALWFVWDGESMWLYSITRSQRWTNLERDPRVSVLVEAGDEYFELRGAELIGSVVGVGEVPRTGEESPELAEPERVWDDKYGLALDGRHAWLRLTPRKIVSWDFRKLGALSA
jgi:nitroimidazol reductase NimA-like FMN-containing flavoprotein (pyridoxamine 5'-phosphate oxidase superfamily)